MQKITVYEIAQMAEVSPATVSNVLNGRKNVGTETRERILKICREMGYNTERHRELGKQDPRTILFNFSDFDRKFYLKIIHGISDYVYSRNYDLIVSTTKSCEKFMDPRFTSGAIILDRKCQDSILLEKAKKGYQIVAMDRVFEQSNMRSVIVNNYTPMSELVQGLVNRGYRKFGYLAGPDTLDNQERFKAFTDVLAQNNIPFLKENYLIGTFLEKSGYQAAKLMILSENVPEVLVCANDNMAVGAIKAIRKAGLRIPEDIAITGFDGNEIAEMMNLTTVDIPNYERGYLAAQCLIQNLSGAGTTEPFKIAAKVVWRGSVKDKN